MKYFLDTPVNIEGNSKLRAPQIEAYIKIKAFYEENPNGEALVVLPTGTGKSGLISIAPYDVAKGRVLIITPGLVTKQSIQKTQEVLNDNFWVNFDVIFNPDDIPVISEYSSTISEEHLYQSHIIYSNIQKLGSTHNSGLINNVPPNFFDMIIVDEAHHAPANTWQEVIDYFVGAKVLHVTGTPYRGDNQEVPGEKIHETPLSEVMRDRYVKWLRKETVNANELFFTIPEKPGQKFSKNQILELKEKEWLEKSVALSKACSMDVINHSVGKLSELKNSSPDVPHKILAIGCSIAHAEDLCCWYKEQGLEPVIVHSDMSLEQRDLAFKSIDTHACQVVISVNMLMEGYDHRYLSILALFRPYRSINAFAQVVGRVLRAIPQNEITAFEIDNNAVVIYHEETGLDQMWVTFQKEVDRAKHKRVRDYTLTDVDYTRKDNELADVASDNAFVSDQDSYLQDINFNDLFEAKRVEINESVTNKLNNLKGMEGFDDDDIALFKERLIEKETRKAAVDEIDRNLIEKRPDIARKKMRELLTKKAQDGVTSLLSDLTIDEKGTDLGNIFSPYLQYFKQGTTNDGTLVMFINAKLYSKYGSVKNRDNKLLLNSIDDISNILAEIRKMLSC